MKKILTFFLTALLAFSAGWAETVIDFQETFNQCSGTGGNDGSWSGNIATNNITADNTNWTFSNGNGASKCVKLGTGSKLGSATTPTITVTSGTEYTLTFKAGAWNGSSEKTTLKLSATGGTLSQSTVTLTKGAWNDYSVTFNATGTSATIKFEGYQSSNSRFFLDEVVLSHEGGETPPSGPKYYHKVTSTDEIVAGQKYLIVYEQGNKFLGGIHSSNYGIAVDGPTISGRQVDINGYSDIRELTLDNIQGTSFTLHNGDGYLRFKTSDGTNSLNIQQSVDNYARWQARLDEANGGYYLNNGASSYRHIWYDSAIPGFACYNSTGGLVDNAYLYVEGEAPALPTAVAPTFNPASGASFYGSLDVTISSETNGATIYYTTDGSTPSTSSNSIASGGTVTINSSCTIKAIAVAQGHDNSTVAEASYTKETLPMPTFSPAGGHYDIGSTVEVTINAVGGAAIYYTLDGTDPVPSRTAYTGPITISETTTLKAISVLNGETSEVATAEYVFAAPANTCPATIEFDNTATATITGTGYHVSAGSDIVTTSQSSTAFEESDGIRLGSGSATGSLTLTLASEYNKVKKVVINAKRYQSDEGVVVNVATSNGETRSADIANDNSFADYTFDNFSGNPVNTITISNSATRKRVYIKSVTIYYECAPVATLTATPNPLNINDTNEAGGKTGTILVSGANLGNDNVGMTFSQNHSTNFSSNPGYFSHNGTVTDYPVAITYTGHALSATGIVYPANNVVSTSVNINYLYTGPIYVIGDVNNTYWNTNNGAQMTRDENGVYSTTVSVQQSDGTAGYFTFSKQLGSNYTDGQFGPVSSGNWWYDDNLNDIYQPIDTLGNVNNIRILPGIYTITVNPATNEFKIKRYVIDVTISPEDGTTFTGSTISGTITDSPAGTIEWSTDGTNWQPYTDGFTLTAANVGDQVTIYARSTSNGMTSAVVSATYTRVAAPAPEAPIFSRSSGDVARGTVITITAPEGTTLYVDGQQVTSPYDVTINHNTTISAYCVNDEGTHSETVTNNYTIAAVCEAMIEFDTNGTQSLDGTGYKVTEESDYDAISGTSSTGYLSETTNGIRFGSGSNAGSLTFTLDETFADWNVTKIILNIQKYSNDNNVVVNVSTSNNESANNTLSGNDFANYEFNFSEGNEINSFTISNNGGNQRFNLKSITLVYSCGATVEAPVITPPTGTYYESFPIEITAAEGTTIYFTTDGTDPTTSSRVYSYYGCYYPEYVAGETSTIKAIAVDQDDNVSEITTVTYTWGIPAVTIHPDSRNTLATSINVTLTCVPANSTIYYTTDGSTPSAENGTLYDGGFTVDIHNVGDAVTVKAIAIYYDYNETSPVATATYTHVDELLDVHAPFFSPLENRTYYGDQTLQIGCTTPNADIYYEIVEVDGTTAPSASAVEDPTHASTQYDGTPIEMTAGHSYYVKAIAYIGSYVSTISEGWYVIEPFQGGQYVYQNLKDFNDNCPTGVTATFANPVQVVYHSTYTNDGTSAEFCYVRDNTDYACIYFGKADNNGYHIFEMGDWINGSEIAGVTNIWDRNFHIQLGTSNHEVTSWPTNKIGWSEIIPETTTCNQISSGTSDGDNLWGHYVHLRYTNVTVINVTDGKYKGTIKENENSQATYYDKFYRWSGYPNSLGDYDDNFFSSKQNAGATFDVYGIVDYYKPDEKPFQVCPIDFLWIYKPEISLASGTYTGTQEVEITVNNPEWAAEGVVIYYKTDDMEDWAIYNGPITVNSDTHIQAYAEVAAHKNGASGGANYNDYVRSEIVEATYDFQGIEDPSINPGSMVIELDNDGYADAIHPTVTDNNEAGSGAVTLIHVLISGFDNGGDVDIYDPEQYSYAINAGEEITLDDNIGTNATVIAISYVIVDGEYLWSNPVTATYTFVKTNGIEYNLVKTTPQPGYVYVIVNKDANMGMSTTQNENNRGSIGVLFKDGTDRETVYGNEELAQFVLESTNGGRYYFKNINGGGYLVVTTNEVANLKTSAEASVYSEANVAIGSQDAGYPATITFNYDGTNRYLRYFANGRTFSTHGSATVNEDVFLYGAQATPLAYIESSVRKGSQVIVSDELIGAWSVVNPGTGEKFLWAKDQGNLSIDKRPEINWDYQDDYVKSILHYQQGMPWDESNWVILDFAGIDATPDDYVGFKIKAGSVAGQYTDDVNYRIMLKEEPSWCTETPYQQDATDYPGWEEPFSFDLVGADNYWLGYNTYVPANFMVENHNHYDSNGNVVGFVANESALPGLAGDQFYFMNPKIQEVAHIWAVWCGDDEVTGQPKDLFSVYKAEHKPNENINAWNLNGTFRVKWDYNCKNRNSGDPYSNIYGRATDLVEGVAYEFHAAILRPTDNRPTRLRADGDPEPQGTLNEGTPTPDYVLYPLDIKDGGTWTAVIEKNAPKTVVSVSYYNLMGVESKKPFEGINIVVTRYSDGSTSATKVLR